MMQNRNKYKTRWIIYEHYFGKFDDTQVLAGTGNIQDACYICDALLLLHKGRPFSYKVEKVDSAYIELFDNPIQENPLTGKINDFNKYLKGVSALSIK